MSRIYILITWMTWMAGMPIMSQIIPSGQLIQWVPGITVGTNTGFPSRTNLLNVLSYGCTTNNGSTTGSITSGTNALIVSSAGDFSVGQGVWVSNIMYCVVTNIQGTVFFLNQNAPSTATGVFVGHDNGTTINLAIGAANSNDVVYIPQGTFITRFPIYVTKSYITIRGATNSLLVCLGYGGYGMLVGPGSAGQVGRSWWNIAGVVLKGTNQLVLSTNLDVINANPLSAGTICQISTMNGNDPNFHVMNDFGYERSIIQTVYIQSVSSNTVTFSPPAAWNFTNQPALGYYSLGAAGIGIGLENLSMALTNLGQTSDGFSISDTISVQDCYNTWITGCHLNYAANYALSVNGCVDFQNEYNWLSFSLGSGPGHAGMLFVNCSGMLVQNNILSGFSAAPMEFFGGNIGNAMFANFFTNTSSQCVEFHLCHDMMNLFEENVMDNAFETDGYFGSNSHDPLLRNRFFGSTYWKRFTSYMDLVGNVLGSTNFNFGYIADLSNDVHNPFPLIEVGYPNIGNNGWSNSTPPVSWNWPGNNFQDANNLWHLNCTYTFTNDLLNVTSLTGNWTNWPFGNGYNLAFQDPANTNLYHYLSQESTNVNDQEANSLFFSQQPTTTNAVFNHAVTISNGWTMYVIATQAYQQLQYYDLTNDIITGNSVYTNANGTPVLVWDKNGVQTIPTTLLYTNSPPSWWIVSGTNVAWPAVDPVNANVAMIPAQARFLGIISPTSPRSSSISASGLSLGSGTVVFGQ